MLDFIGIGARRAGEDWLFSQLRRHPEIHFPRELELGFWSTHYPRSLTQPDYARDLDWYRSVFGHWPHGVLPQDSAQERPVDAAQIQWKRNWFDRMMAALDGLDSSAKPARMASLDAAPPAEAQPVVQASSKLGDFSPSYNCFADPHTVQAIRDFAPELRLLYIIRDPRQRAWAAAEKLRELAGLAPEETSDAWYIDHFRSAQSRRQGDYAAAITQWHKAFPAERLLILRYEDIAADPHALLRRACHHIGVADADYFAAEPQTALLRDVPADTPIRQSLLPALQEIYSEKMANLIEVCGIDYGIY